MAKAKAKKNTLLRVSVILFLLYVVISLVQIQGSIQKNREQLAALEQQNEEQRIANKELERILSDGTEEEYIEPDCPGTAGICLSGRTGAGGYFRQLTAKITGGCRLNAAVGCGEYCRG